MQALPHLTAGQRKMILAIAPSYSRFSGRALVSAHGDALEALWSAPQVIVAHDTADDPVFYFGNRAALELFEMDFPALTRLPSRYSAEPVAREERARLLERVNRDGIIEDYAGVRISSTGRRFRIAQACVWNVVDEHGVRIGQAAAFRDWEPLSP